MITIKALIVAIMITMGLATPVSETSIYPQTFIVTEVCYEDDIEVLEDFTGNIWECAGCEDWAKGDIASAIMSNNGTDEMYDDVILSLKYSGYVNK